MVFYTFGKAPTYLPYQGRMAAGMLPAWPHRKQGSNGRPPAACEEQQTS